MDTAAKVLSYLLAAVSLGVVPTLLAIGLILLYSPEKIEKWSVLLAKWLSGLGGWFGRFHKQYVKLDIQHGLNVFVRDVGAVMPYLQTKKVRVELVDGNTDRENFIRDGKVVLRLKREDPGELNFVHGAYMFVATSLLANIKRYISPSQREALDLYVTSKLLERERHEVTANFLGAYLLPRLDDASTKRHAYYMKFSVINDAGVFYPVLLQELDFVGRKVFGGPRGDKVIIEVDALISFLEDFSCRHIGKQGGEDDLNFSRDFCRFGVMIVGRRMKIENEGAQPYVNYVRKSLIPKKIENVYIIGLLENKDLIDHICSELDEVYEVISSYEGKKILRYGEDDHRETDGYVALIRRRELPLVTV